MEIDQDFLNFRKCCYNKYYFNCPEMHFTWIFPKTWKEAKVTSLYKSCPRDEINNYRPISILPTYSKLIEKFIQVHLFSYLNDFELSIKLKVDLGQGILLK